MATMMPMWPEIHSPTPEKSGLGRCRRPRRPPPPPPPPGKLPPPPVRPHWSRNATKPRANQRSNWNGNKRRLTRSTASRAASVAESCSAGTGMLDMRRPFYLGRGLQSRARPRMLWRTMPAPVLALLGPTNTGKTHLAIERMLEHRTGMIGFPLRLLARENYDRLVQRRAAPTRSPSSPARSGSCPPARVLRLHRGGDAARPPRRLPGRRRDPARRRPRARPRLHRPPPARARRARRPCSWAPRPSGRCCGGWCPRPS